MLKGNWNTYRFSYQVWFSVLCLFVFTFLLHYLLLNCLILIEQGFSNVWCHGTHEEIDHNLRSPTINFINAVIASLDSCKISQVSILISKRIARGALGLRTEHFENLCPRVPRPDNRKGLGAPTANPLCLAITAVIYVQCGQTSWPGLIKIMIFSNK